MKRLTKLTALLLCAALVLSLFGCTAQPAETTAPVTEPPVTTVPPTEPVAAGDVYAAARDELDAASHISLDLLVTTTITIAGDAVSEQSKQTLTYQGLGSEDLKICLAESILYNVHGKQEHAEEEVSDPIAYSEIYADGILYVQLDDENRYTGAPAEEDPMSRYLPVVLLDAALYDSVTSESTANGTKIIFADPSAPESWAVPEGAELIEASGSALVDSSGRMEQMDYAVSYTYGPAQFRFEVTSRPLTETSDVRIPEDPEAYLAVQYVDAARLLTRGAALMAQADSMSVSSLESVVSQAAGVVRNHSTSMDLWGRKEQTMTKIEHDLYFMNYATNENQEMHQEETYRDGKYSAKVDDGVPTMQTGVSYKEIREHCGELSLSHFVSFEYWQDVTRTDLGSVYLLELDLTEDFGHTMQNAICTTFWQDPAFLNNLASAYVTNETTGYIAFDVYTNLPTAAGFYYEGTHTIQGYDYTVSLQSDQSIEVPAKGAYFAITEEMPPEEAPEVMPTPLFYHVTGPNGQEMWLLGTIHVGDERTAYLPKEIYDAFAASDALALEINSKAFDEQLEEDDALQDKVSDAYYYADGSTLEGMMDEEDYAYAVQLMKATGNYNMNVPYMKPSIWAQSIENFYLRQGYALHGDQGVEERLHKWAEDLDKEIREVESSLFQINMMTGYSRDLQLLLLEDAMATYASEYWDGVMELYELWCAGDEEGLWDAINEDVDLSELTEEELAEYEEQKPLIDEYNKAMSYDRNDGMLQVAIDYLESGDVVFYAVGLAHLLDETNGLVEALRQAGYTVELVSYAG